MQPDNERGAPGQEGAPRKLTDKLATEDKRTPALARLTWNGHPTLLSNYWRRDLCNAGREPDALALVIFESLGPKRSRAVAYELLGLSQEVV